MYGKNGLAVPKILLLTAIEDQRLKMAALKGKCAHYFLNKPASSFELEQILLDIENENK